MLWVPVSSRALAAVTSPCRHVVRLNAATENSWSTQDTLEHQSAKLWASHFKRKLSFKTQRSAKETSNYGRKFKEKNPNLTVYKKLVKEIV